MVADAAGAAPLGGMGTIVTAAIKLEASEAGGADHTIQAKVDTSRMTVTATVHANTLAVNKRSGSKFIFGLSGIDGYHIKNYNSLIRSVEFLSS